MAVFRSDQAQFTFAPEGAHGGYPEAATGVSDGVGTAVINMTNGLEAGSRHITVNALDGVTAGEYIQIGNAATEETEVRRVEYVDGSTGLTLDAPTAFFHPDDDTIKVVLGVTEATTDKFISWVPGVYETVDTPDPEMAIEGRYLLGVGQKRNFFQAYKGQQTFTGSVGSFVLLNGWPLRFPIGKVNSIPVGGVPGAATTSINGDYTDATDANGARKGDYWINVDSAASIAVGDLIAIGYDASPTASTNTELRRIITETSTTIRLNYPLQFNHADNTEIHKITEGSVTNYRHDIFETVDLDTMSWNVHMRDSGETAANDFNRRWFGGHCGSMSISADEGGLLTAGWDSVTFQDMVHNQKLYNKYDADATVSVINDAALPGFQFMRQISSADIGVPAKAGNSVTAAHGGFPSTEPYYFSQGSLVLSDRVFARVRNFSISISNAEEPRYYINNQGKGTRRHRGPSEIRENQREYSMSATVALPDSGNATTNDAVNLFKELILEGDYGAEGSADMSGFKIVLTFTRGSNDSITFTIPDDGTAAAGGGQQGAFIRSAAHGITGDNPLQTDVDILFRNMKIQINDSEPFYP